MPMTIIGRINLGGTPSAPIIVGPGDVVYRNANTVRRVNFDAGTDILVGTINHPGNNNVVGAALVNNYYSSTTLQTYIAPGGAHYLTGMNIDTGAYEVRQIPPGTTTIGGVGVVRKLGNPGAERACTVTQDLGPTNFESSVVFPAGAIIKTQVNANGGILTNEQYLTGHLKGPSTGAAPGAQQRLGLWNGVNFSDGLSNIRLITPLDGKVIAYYGQESGYPWFFEQDSTFIYLFGVNLTDRRVVAVRINKTTFLQDYSVDIGLSAGGAPGGDHYNAFRITEAFSRSHFSAYANVAGQQARIYSSPAWPIDITDFVALDTGACTITGIWTQPPFVFVTKTSGPTFGNQLIKIYDPALDSIRRSRRSGSEIWELIPEIGQWLM